jgi:hypothetical protein
VAPPLLFVDDSSNCELGWPYRSHVSRQVEKILAFKQMVQHKYKHTHTHTHTSQGSMGVVLSQKGDKNVFQCSRLLFELEPMLINNVPFDRIGTKALLESIAFCILDGASMRHTLQQT